MPVTKALIIPAAGRGRRMKRDIPKPYLQLRGKAILGHTISRFLKLRGLQFIAVATPTDYISEAEKVLQQCVPESVQWQCVEGGDRRQDSIFKALQLIDDVDLIIVHDAVRPFVSVKHIQQCCEEATAHGAAILGTPASDTIKRLDDEHNVVETPDRSDLWQVQTPQIFQAALLREAYEKAQADEFAGTDDASLVERLGRTVKVVKGNRSNFKITFPVDLQFAEVLLNQIDDDE